MKFFKKIFALLIMIMGASGCLTACKQNPYENMKLSLSEYEKTVVYNTDVETNTFKITATVDGVEKDVSTAVTFSYDKNALILQGVNKDGNKTTAIFEIVLADYTEIVVKTLEGGLTKKTLVNVVIPVTEIKFVGSENDKTSLSVIRNTYFDLDNNKTGNALLFYPKSPATNQRQVKYQATDLNGVVLTDKQVVFDENKIKVIDQDLDRFKLVATSVHNDQITSSILINVLDNIDKDVVSLFIQRSDETPVQLETISQDTYKVTLSVYNADDNIYKNAALTILTNDSDFDYEKYTFSYKQSVLESSQSIFTVGSQQTVDKQIQLSNALKAGQEELYIYVAHKGYEDTFDKYKITIKVCVNTFPQQIKLSQDSQGENELSSLVLYGDYQAGVYGTALYLNIFSEDNVLAGQFAKLKVYDIENDYIIDDLSLIGLTVTLENGTIVNQDTLVKSQSKIFVRFNSNISYDNDKFALIAVHEIFEEQHSSYDQNVIRYIYQSEFLNDIDDQYLQKGQTIELGEQLLLGADSPIGMDELQFDFHKQGLDATYSDENKQWVISAQDQAIGKYILTIIAPNKTYIVVNILVYTPLTSSNTQLKIGDKKYNTIPADAEIQSYDINTCTNTIFPIKFVLDGVVYDDFIDGIEISSVVNDSTKIGLSSDNSTLSIYNTACKTEFTITLKSDVKDNSSLETLIFNFTVNIIRPIKTINASIASTDIYNKESVKIEDTKLASQYTEKQIVYTTNPDDYNFDIENVKLFISYQNATYYFNQILVDNNKQILECQILDFTVEIVLKYEKPELKADISIVQGSTESIFVLVLQYSQTFYNAVGEEEQNVKTASTQFNMINANNATKINANKSQITFSKNQLIYNNSNSIDRDTNYQDVNFWYSFDEDMLITGAILQIEGASFGKEEYNSEMTYIFDYFKVELNNDNHTIRIYLTGIPKTSKDINMKLCSIDSYSRNKYFVTREINLKYVDGSSEDNAFLISTPEQFMDIQNDLTSHYKLTNNLNFANVKDYAPIGDAMDQFTGTFNGQGYKIYNLTIVSKNDLQHVGLFGYIGKKGKVSNLHLQDYKFQVVYSNTYLDSESVFPTIFIGSIAGSNAGIIEKVSVQDNSDYGYGVNYSYHIENSTINQDPEHGIIFNRDSIGINNDKAISVFMGGIAGSSLNNITNCNAYNTIYFDDDADYINVVAGGVVGVLGSNKLMPTITYDKASNAYNVVAIINPINVSDKQPAYQYQTTNKHSIMGGVAGISYGIIENGYFKCILNGLDNIGGIAGYNYGTVQSNTVHPTLIGKNNIGGVAAFSINTKSASGNDKFIFEQYVDDTFYFPNVFQNTSDRLSIYNIKDAYDNWTSHEYINYEKDTIWNLNSVINSNKVEIINNNEILDFLNSAIIGDNKLGGVIGVSIHKDTYKDSGAFINYNSITNYRNIDDNMNFDYLDNLNYKSKQHKYYGDIIINQIDKAGKYKQYIGGIIGYSSNCRLTNSYVNIVVSVNKVESSIVNQIRYGGTIGVAYYVSYQKFSTVNGYVSEEIDIIGGLIGDDDIVDAGFYNDKWYDNSIFENVVQYSDFNKIEYFNIENSYSVFKIYNNDPNNEVVPYFVDNFSSTPEAWERSKSMIVEKLEWEDGKDTLTSTYYKDGKWVQVTGIPSSQVDSDLIYALDGTKENSTHYENVGFSRPSIFTANSYYIGFETHINIKNGDNTVQTDVIKFNEDQSKQLYFNVDIDGTDYDCSYYSIDEQGKNYCYYSNYLYSDFVVETEYVTECSYELDSNTYDYEKINVRVLRGTHIYVYDDANLEYTPAIDHGISMYVVNENTASGLNEDQDGNQILPPDTNNNILYYNANLFNDSRPISFGSTTGCILTNYLGDKYIVDLIYNIPPNNIEITPNNQNIDIPTVTANNNNIPNVISIGVGKKTVDQLFTIGIDPTFTQFGKMKSVITDLSNNNAYDVTTAGTFNFDKIGMYKFKITSIYDSNISDEYYLSVVRNIDKVSLYDQSQSKGSYNMDNYSSNVDDENKSNNVNLNDINFNVDSGSITLESEMYSLDSGEFSSDNIKYGFKVQTNNYSNQFTINGSYLEEQNGKYTQYFESQSKLTFVGEGYFDGQITIIPVLEYTFKYGNTTYTYQNDLTDMEFVADVNITYKVSDISLSTNKIEILPNTKDIVDVTLYTQEDSPTFDMSVGYDNGQTVEFKVTPDGDNGYKINYDNKSSVNITSLIGSKDVDNILEVVLLTTTPTNNDGEITFRFEIKTNIAYVNNIIKDYNYSICFGDISANQILNVTIQPSPVAGLVGSLYSDYKENSDLDNAIEEYNAYDDENYTLYYNNQSSSIIPGQAALFAIETIPSYSDYESIEITSSSPYITIVQMLMINNGTVDINQFISTNDFSTITNGIKISNKCSSIDATNSELSYNGVYYIRINTPTSLSGQEFTINVKLLDKNGNLAYKQTTFTYSCVKMPTIQLSSVLDYVGKTIPSAFGVDTPFKVVASNYEFMEFSFAIDDENLKLPGRVSRDASDLSLYFFDYLINPKDTVYTHKDYYGKTLKITGTVTGIINGKQYTQSDTIQLLMTPYVLQDIQIKVNGKDNYQLYYNQTYSLTVDIIADYYDKGNVESEFYQEIQGYLEQLTNQIAFDSMKDEDSNQSKYFTYINGNTASPLDINEDYNGFSYNLGKNNSNNLCFSSTNVNYQIGAEIEFSYTNQDYVDGSYVGGIKLSDDGIITHLFKSSFTPIVLRLTSEDNPSPIFNEQEFIDALNEVDDYILQADLVLENWQPSQANFDSLDGNGFVIYIQSFDQKYITENNLTEVGLFTNISERTTIKNVTIQVQKEDYQLELDLGNLTGVSFGVLAGVNKGVVTNTTVTHDASAIVNDRNALIKDQIIDASITGIIMTDDDLVEASAKKDNLVTDVVIKTTDTTSVNSSIVVGGLVGKNEGYITNSNVENISLYGMETVAGFAAYNTKKISSSYFSGGNVKNAEKDNSVAAGFVAYNSGEISYSYVMGRMVELTDKGQIVETNDKYKNSIITTKEIDYTKYSGYTYQLDQTNVNALLAKENSIQLRAMGSMVSSNGNAGGFVYENSNQAIISNSYSNILIDSKDGAGFAYINKGGKIEYSYSMSAGRLEGNNFKPFTGSNSETLAGDIIDAFYLKVDSQDYPSSIAITPDVFSEEMRDLGEGVNATKFADYNAFRGYAFNGDYSSNTNVSTSVWFIPNDNSNTADSPSNNHIKSYFKQDNYLAKRPELVSANLHTQSIRVYKVTGNGTQDGSDNSVDSKNFDYESVALNNMGQNIELGENVLNPILIDNSLDFNAYTKQTAVDSKDKDDSTDENETPTTAKSLRFIKDITFDNDVQSAETYAITYGGDLEGNGMTINNLRLIADIDNIDAEIENLGLFAKISNGYVRNLNVVIDEIYGSNVSKVGVLAGEIVGSKIHNIDIYGDKTIEGYNAVGGVAGYIHGNSQVVNVFSQVSVKSNFTGNVNAFNKKNITPNKNTFELYDGSNIENVGYAGGIAGIIDITTSDTFSNDNIKDLDPVKRNVVSGDVTISAQVAGGIYGYIGKDTKVSTSQLFINENTQIIASRASGGIVGHLMGKLDRSIVSHNEELQLTIDKNIKNNYNKIENLNTSDDYVIPGNISTLFAGNPHFMGGIAGIAIESTISNSYNRVDVKNINAQVAGGVIGLSIASDINVAYTTADVLAFNSIGGIIGYNLSLNNLYLDEQDLYQNFYMFDIVKGINDDINKPITIGSLFNKGYDSNLLKVCGITSATKVDEIKQDSELFGIVGANLWQGQSLNTNRKQHNSQATYYAYVGTLVGRTFVNNDCFGILTKDYASRCLNEDMITRLVRSYNSIAANLKGENIVYQHEIGNKPNINLGNESQLQDIGITVMLGKSKNANSSQDITMMTGTYEFTNTITGIKSYYYFSRLQNYSSGRTLYEILLKAYNLDQADDVIYNYAPDTNKNEIGSMAAGAKTQNQIYYNYSNVIWGNTNMINNLQDTLDKAFPDIITSLDPARVYVTSEKDLLLMNDYLSAEFILMNDIELVSGWNPVGSNDKPFRGSVRSDLGQQYSISNMSVNSGKNIGLVANAEGAKFYDFNLTQAQIKAVSNSVGVEYVGLIAAQADNCQFDNIGLTQNIIIANMCNDDKDDIAYVGGILGNGKNNIIQNLAIKDNEFNIGSTKDNINSSTNDTSTSLYVGGVAGNAIAYKNIDKDDSDNGEQSIFMIENLLIENNNTTITSNFAYNYVSNGFGYLKSQNPYYGPDESDGTNYPINNIQLINNQLRNLYKDTSTLYSYVGQLIAQSAISIDNIMLDSNSIISNTLGSSDIGELVADQAGYSISNIVSQSTKFTNMGTIQSNIGIDDGVADEIIVGLIGNVDGAQISNIILDNSVYGATTQTVNSTVINAIDDSLLKVDQQNTDKPVIGYRTFIYGQSHRFYAGLIGEISNSTVTDIYNLNGNIDILCNYSESKIGGLIGNNVNSDVIQSYTNANIRCQNYSNLDCYVGGAIGYANLSDNTIDQVVSNGKIDCFNSNESADVFIGGLIGKLYSGRVMNSYSTSSIYARSNMRIGGLISHAVYGEVENCYSISTMNYYEKDFVKSSFDSYRSGLVNIKSAGTTITDCYYNLDIAGTNSEYGTGLSTTDFLIKNGDEIQLGDQFNQGVNKYATLKYFDSLKDGNSDDSTSDFKNKLNNDQYFISKNLCFNYLNIGDKGSREYPRLNDYVDGDRSVIIDPAMVTDIGDIVDMTVYFDSCSGEQGYNNVDKFSALIGVGVEEKEDGGSLITIHNNQGFVSQLNVKINLSGYYNLANNGIIFNCNVEIGSVENNNGLIISSYIVNNGKDNTGDKPYSSGKLYKCKMFVFDDFIELDHYNYGNSNNSMIISVNDTDTAKYDLRIFDKETELNFGDVNYDNSTEILSFANATGNVSTKFGQLDYENVYTYVQSDATEIGVKLQWELKEYYFDDHYKKDYCWDQSSSGNITTVIGENEPVVSSLEKGQTYNIASADALGEFAGLWNHSDSELSNVVINITDEIDLYGKLFTPIGTKSNPFDGIVNGNGHTITGLNIVSGDDAIGMFGYVYKIDINDLKITNANIIDYKYGGSGTGLLVGSKYCVNEFGLEYAFERGTKTDVQKVSVTDSTIMIHTANYVSGLIGNPGYNATIQNCYAMYHTNTSKTRGIMYVPVTNLFEKVLTTDSHKIIDSYAALLNDDYSLEQTSFSDINEQKVFGTYYCYGQTGFGLWSTFVNANNFDMNLDWGVTWNRESGTNKGMPFFLTNDDFWTAHAQPFTGDTIKNAYEFAYLIEHIDDCAGSYKIHEKATLDMSTYLWKPIDKSSDSKMTIDFNDVKVQNVKCMTSDRSVGLFGDVKNLTLCNLYVISGIFSNKAIDDEINAGGIIAKGDNVTLLNIISNDATVSSANACAGGVAGQLSNSFIENVQVNYSNINGEYAGGFIGKTENCKIYNGKMTSPSRVTGVEYSGGLVGSMSSTEIIQCSTDYTTILAGSFLGGVAGTVNGENNVIISCYIKGTTKLTPTANNSNVGGIVGIINTDAAVDIFECEIGQAVIKETPTEYISQNGEGEKIFNIKSADYKYVTVNDDYYLELCNGIVGNVDTDKNCNINNISVNIATASGDTISNVISADDILNNNCGRVIYYGRYDDTNKATQNGQAIDSEIFSGTYTQSYPVDYPNSPGDHTIYCYSLLSDLPIWKTVQEDIKGVSAICSGYYTEYISDLKLINSLLESHAGSTFKNNLIFDNHYPLTISNFKGIGTYYTPFNGDVICVSNFPISINNSTSDSLFNYVKGDDTVFSGLNVSLTSSIDTYYVSVLGGLINYNIFGSNINIFDCNISFDLDVYNYSDDTISKNSNVGGVVGDNNGTLVIDGVKNELTIQDPGSSIGGIVGYSHFQGYTLSNTSILNCTTTIKAGINSDNIEYKLNDIDIIGGLIGQAYGDNTILENNIVNEFKVDNNCTSVGGLIGYSTGSTQTITNNTVAGVTVGDNCDRIGGIIGSSNKSKITLESNTTKVTTGDNCYYIGGMIGRVDNGTIVVDNINETFDIHTEIVTGTQCYDIGGVIGYAYDEYDVQDLSVNIKDVNTDVLVKGYCSNVGGIIGVIDAGYASINFIQIYGNETSVNAGHLIGAVGWAQEIAGKLVYNIGGIIGTASNVSNMSINSNYVKDLKYYKNAGTIAGVIGELTIQESDRGEYETNKIMYNKIVDFSKYFIAGSTGTSGNLYSIYNADADAKEITTLTSNVFGNGSGNYNNNDRIMGLYVAS